MSRYAEAQADVDLLALREEIGLIDARLSDVLSRVDTGESGQGWRDLRSAYDAVISARGDPAEAAALMRELGDMIRQGAGDWQAWGDVRVLIQERRKLVESEGKRLVAMQSMISTERVMVLVGALTDIIRKHVHDRDALVAISAELGVLTTRDTVGADRAT